MAKVLDQILVVDVESTCWEGEPPAGQSSEIIQVGLCVVEVASLQRLEKRSLLVKPVQSEVGAFCTGLTGLTPDMFVEAMGFPEALRVLRNGYRAKDRLWASWGDYDRRQFERQCEQRQVGYPFGPGHLNVKSLFAAAMGLDREVGLDEAYQKLGWTMEGRHHRGDDDAWNIAAVLGMLLGRMREGGRV